MIWPVSISMLVEHARRNRRGVSSDLIQTGFMLGFTMEPYLDGYLWTRLGKTFPYYASTLFLTLCIPIVPYIREVEKS